MRWAVWIRARRLRWGAALILCGLLLGAGLTYPFGIERIHHLERMVRELQSQCELLQNQLTRYEKVQADKISILFRGKIPSYVQDAVEQAVIDRLAPHVGKELAEIDPLLLEQAIDGQQVSVEQTTWLVEVRSLRVSDRLEFTLQLTAR